MPPVLSLNQFPLEILLGIFRYLDIPDILRLRRVCRYLEEVDHRRGVWTDAYHQADFIRPPGPFLSQSAHDLENALVPNFRLNRNLRHLNRKAHKIREIRYPAVELDARLVFGRFLLIALIEEILCYDLNFDSNLDASIVYRPTCGTTINSFRCVSAIDVEGRSFACVILNEAVWQAGNRTSIYLLNVTKKSKVTLDLLHQFDYEQFHFLTVQLGPRVILVSGIMGSSANGNWHVVALDVHARTQYLLELPSFTCAGWEVEMLNFGAVTPLTSISTSTHLLLARSLYTEAAGWSIFCQAFTLPPPNVHESFTPLSHSHRGTISDMDAIDVVVLQDAIHDPSTQDSLITLRVDAFPHSKHGTLRLGRSSDDVGTITFQLLGSFGSFFQTPLFHPSFHGTGRVLYSPGPDRFGIMEYDIRSNNDCDDEPVANS